MQVKSALEVLINIYFSRLRAIHVCSFFELYSSNLGTKAFKFPTLLSKMWASLITIRKDERLQRKGEIRKLQQYRYRKTRALKDELILPPIITEEIPKFLRHEQELREVAQREATLENESNRGSLSPTRLEEIQQELLSLKSKY